MEVEDEEEDVSCLRLDRESLFDSCSPVSERACLLEEDEDDEDDAGSLVSVESLSLSRLESEVVEVDLGASLGTGFG